MNKFEKFSSVNKIHTALVGVRANTHKKKSHENTEANAWREMVIIICCIFRNELKQVFNDVTKGSTKSSIRSRNAVTKVPEKRYRELEKHQENVSK